MRRDFHRVHQVGEQHREKSPLTVSVLVQTIGALSAKADLAKICTRLEFPVPPRGYWAKLAAGKRAPEIPLPSTDSKLPSEIQIATLR
jgi:hypothetical protein